MEVSVRLFKDVVEACFGTDQKSFNVDEMEQEALVSITIEKSCGFEDK